MDDSNLSERELELIKLVATGASNKEISQHLHISVNTVKVHLRNIFTKLEVSSRTEAAMWAVQNGVVDASGSNEISLEGQDKLDEVPSHPIRQWIANASLSVRLIAFGVLGVVLVILGFGISQIVQSVQAPNPTEQVISVSDFEESRWKQLADMPTARAGLAAAAYDNRIYAIAGEGFDGVLDANERYNPQTDTWEILSPKPLPVADVHAGVIGGRIYIPGGRLENGDITDVLEVFDPRTGTWSEGTPLPIAMSAYALAPFEGKLYVFGGWDGMNYLDNVFMYDPAQEIWIERSPMPTARAFAGAAEAGGKIYVIGGYDGEEGLAVNEVYEPALEIGVGNPWTTRESVPGEWVETGIVSVAEKIYIVGMNNDPMVTIHEFATQDNEWQTIEASVIPQRLRFESISAGPEILVLGGIEGDEYLKKNISYQVVYTISIPIVR